MSNAEEVPAPTKPTLKYAIVGSRDFPDMDAVREFVHGFYDYVHGSPFTGVIVSGGARGVDRVAEQTATELGLATEIYPADWEKHGRSAGYIRNEDIVKASDVVVAFWDSISRGTKHSIDLAIKHQKNLLIIYPTGEREKYVEGRKEI